MFRCQRGYPILETIRQTRLFHRCIERFFSVTGLYERGKNNALNLKLRRLDFSFDNLPSAFNGYTILFISDLHLDSMAGVTQSILNLVDGLCFDLCLLGGDYYSTPLEALPKALTHLKYLIHRIKAPNGTFAVLGNHDSLGMVDLLKQDNITFLMNGARSIKKRGQSIRLVGIDDPACYGRYGVTGRGTLDEISEFTIVVSHRPDFYMKAAKRGADFYLCGHTHAGQVRLPFIGPVVINGNVLRDMIHGKWMYRNMQGYTSSGAGTTGIPVRYGCRGEVVLITLTLGTH